MSNPNLPKTPRRNAPRRRRPRQPNNNWIFWIVLGFILLLMMSQTSTMPPSGPVKELTYTEFYQQVKNNPQTESIKDVTMVEGATETTVKGKYTDGSEFRLNIPTKEYETLVNTIADDPNITFEVKPPQTFWQQVFFSFMPILIIILFIWFISQRGAQMGNRIWSFGKSRARLNTKENNEVTFKDVSGVDEAKEELQEVIEFLKDPKKFERLGGKIPKGVLLVGPPGTGKTLLAKAVAGEAGVPFYSLSGSDFVEMFVGVGASRVRDLFEQGRKASRTSGKGAIIFIDEIDAVGRLRFAGIGGGNDEREQTLNALLVEMDGFNNTGGLILIAATNRPDTLDPALLRPGRFDRQIVVGLPDINGREGILKVHTKKIKMADDVDLRKIAQQTVYFSGADLANVCNEAALLAARRNRESVGMEEMFNAVERVTMGPEKRSRSASEKETELVAYHEAGHALLSLMIDEVNTFTKVSIIPRGMAGGYTLTPPTEDKHYYNKKELMGMITVSLGGLVAEELHLGDTSTGVSGDLQHVTKTARSMVCDYGMSDNLGTLAYGQHDGQGFLGRDLMKHQDYSGHTAKLIDEEVQSLVDEAYSRARKLLSENIDRLNKLAEALMKKETLTVDQTIELLDMQGDVKQPEKFQEPPQDISPENPST